MPQHWRSSAATCAAWGRACGELGAFKQAVDYYEKAKNLEPADAAAQALEQLANLKARWAEALSREPDPSVALKPEELFRDARSIIKCLIELGPSQERYSIQGSVHKRYAGFSRGAARHKALETMAESYRSAYEWGVKANKANVYYPLQNWLAADIVLAWKKSVRASAKKPGPKPGEIQQRLNELNKLADQAVRRGADFWGMCQRPDAQLLKVLPDQKFTEAESGKIKAGYLAAKRRGRSARELHSAIENVAFFEAMAETEADAKHRDALIDVLKTLRKALEDEVE
jgi:tetratricopeptide (TPR) repeat protein